MIVNDRARGPFRGFRGFGTADYGPKDPIAAAAATAGTITSIAEDIVTVITGRPPAATPVATYTPGTRPPATNSGDKLLMAAGAAAVVAALLILKR